MQAYTEEQRAELVAFLNAEIARIERKKEQGDGDKLRIESHRITLAALTAKPVGTIRIEMDWNTHRNVATLDMREDLVAADMRTGDKLYTTPTFSAPAVPDGFVIVPRALTAENGAKAALLGEFNLEYNLVCHECFGEGCDDCSGEGRWIKSIPVDWTTIKEIWAKGIEHFQAAAPEVGDLQRCAAARDGECNHARCPQLRDGEPKNSGRHCPIDNWDEDDD